MVRIGLMALNVVLVLVLIGLGLVVPACAEDASHGYTEVSVGGSFVVALRDDGTVWTWGAMHGEKIGDNNSWVQPTPVQVPIENVVAVSAGWEHGMALKKDGTVWTWGSNDYGQLGDGTTMSAKWYTIVPVEVKGLGNVTMISAGPWQSVALKSDGTVWSWGANGVGNLGDGTLEDRHSPVQVKGLNNVTSVSSGFFAIKSDGSVWTWGMALVEPDQTGQVSVSTAEELQAACRPTPFQVPGLTNTKSIDTEDTRHTVFVKNDGTVWSWGYNTLGRLGDGSTNDEGRIYVKTPVQAKGLNDVNMAVAADSSSIALKDDGIVCVWGSNGLGQLGTGRNDILWVPTQIKGLTNVSSLSASDTNAAFIRDDGSVWVCGDNSYGQKGDGTVDCDVPISTPVRVLGAATYGNTITGNDDTVIAPEPLGDANNNDNNDMSTGVTRTGDNGMFGIIVLGISALVIILGCVVYLFVLRKI
jgi:alpha-tubulin suppressor-like RCC1 family protein